MIPYSLEKLISHFVFISHFPENDFTRSSFSQKLCFLKQKITHSLILTFAAFLMQCHEKSVWFIDMSDLNRHH